MEVSEIAESAARQIVKQYIDLSANFTVVHNVAETIQRAMEEYHDAVMQDLEGS